MKHNQLRALWLVWLGLFLASGAWAQTSITTSSSATSGCATITTDTDKSTVGVQITGTWTGTLQPQVAIQGQAPVNTQVTPTGSSTPQSTITANGLFIASVAGTSTFQICGPTGTGTALVWLNVSKAAVKIQGGGGGSGTVSANNGVVNAITTYAAAGGSTTVAPAAAGVACLPGATSGSSCFTANAIAGTVGNPVVMTNALMFPVGAVGLPAIRFNDTFTDGFYSSGTNAVTWAQNGGANGVTLNGSKYQASNAGVFCWNSAAGDSTAACDTGISRAGAAIASFGNGTAQDKTGFILSGMTKFVTADFTTSGVGTALENITGLSFTFPAIALNWSFHCHIGYHQNVATAAVAFGIQDTTNAPANLMAVGHAQSNATVFNEGVLAALNTTTATNIVSGVTPSAITTNWVAEVDGTVEHGATAHTLNLMTSTATAADTVTVLRGSYCSLTP